MRPAGSLLVKNVFYTIQGEGTYAGTPAVFVRLAGCNRGMKSKMGCAFCDTDFRSEGAVEMNGESLVSRIHREISGFVVKPRLVVFTGGEPMLQDEIAHTICLLQGRRFLVQIESNGDRLADGFRDNCSAAYLVVSPKYNDPHQRVLRPDVFRRADAFKFLIDARVDSPYSEVPRYSDMIERKKVFLSPITVYKRTVLPSETPSGWDHNLIDVEQTRRNYAKAADIAMNNGWRVSMQQHLFFTLP